MGKIISINERIVTIGLDNGTMREVRMDDLNFNPVVGDEVDIYESLDKVIVTKKETVRPQQEGININVTNSNGFGGNGPVYVGGQKAVNKVIYCLLAFFLGGIGIHKFYAGKTGSGILYMLFCWTFIPGFIAFIEFIMALIKPADSVGNILV